MVVLFSQQNYSKADVKQSKFSHEKLGIRNSYTAAYTTIQDSCRRNMANDGDDDLAVAATMVLSALNDTQL